jgi:hypothetical protein
MAPRDKNEKSEHDALIDALKAQAAAAAHGQMVFHEAEKPS